MENILFSIGNDAKSRRAKNYDMTWPEFIAEMMDYIDEPSLGVEFSGDETKEQYDRKKKQQNYIAAAVDKVRSNDTVLGRSILFIDLDGVTTRQVRKVTRTLDEKGYAYFAHGTSSDRHALKGGADVRAVRFLIPTNRPMDADEIWHVQHSFLNWIGLDEMEGVDMTACQRARIMFVPPYGAEWWEGKGKPVRVSQMLNNGYEPPSESGNTVWSEESLAAASENSQAIAGWAFEMGLEMMSSGRGWAVQCPNHMSHTDGRDGTEGDTAIMLPDSLHPEVRFVCQHAHCRNLNSHQHMMLQLVGVPNSYLPEAHNISKKQIAELFPFMDEDEVEYVHCNQVEAAADGLDAHICQDEDLMDEPCALFTKRDPIIDGLYNFKSTFELVGESNIGKSFFLLGQMACASAGIPFAGAKVIKSHSFYFDAEGGSTTIDRKQALQKTYGDDLDWLHIIDLQSEGWDITSKAGQRAIIRHIRTTAGSDPVGLVAFDSLNQSVALSDKPFDENSSSDMGTVASALKAIADETGACAGVVHHPAKSEKGARRIGRGSGALHGAVDFVYFIEQPDESEPLRLNFYMEKARGSTKQLPRGFLLAKCKIEVAHGHADAILALQSDREAPDFSAFLEGQTVKPLDSQPRDETLVLIPVALAPFDSKAADVGRQAVKQTEQDGPMLRGTEQAVYAALEELQNERDDGEGFAPADVIKIVGKGGDRYKILKELAKRKIIWYGRDENGRLLNGENGTFVKYRIPTDINDLEDSQPTSEEDDLEN
ncbi:AAA family ATPase [Salmonella enterica subsp. enterica serovar Cerro]|nr:AAA family ATPase [Salmonella enterica]EBH8405782.1 helicase [Salmonella enterica subsp. enterica serovar Cerro]EAY2247673.1 AAA family ATPase [Salmonella enterica]EBH9253237.1 AAA family ATPase [Salmonella enterica subsp. enterica serovar Cerro]EBH9938172.1 AAA family ATPase [Salmonella enterica subsp. enterica serovar Cerro]